MSHGDQAVALENRVQHIHNVTPRHGGWTVPEALLQRSANRPFCLPQENPRDGRSACTWMPCAAAWILTAGVAPPALGIFGGRS